MLCRAKTLIYSRAVSWASGSVRNCQGLWGCKMWWGLILPPTSWVTWVNLGLIFLHFERGIVYRWLITANAFSRAKYWLSAVAESRNSITATIFSSHLMMGIQDWGWYSWLYMCTASEGLGRTELAGCGQAPTCSDTKQRGALQGAWEDPDG